MPAATGATTLGARTFAGTQSFMDGLLADCAIWNTVLNSTQAAQLVAGYRPIDVNSANLIGWWPLSGYSSPEPDISSGARNGTLTGTSAAPMPPSISRGARQFIRANNDYVTVSSAVVTASPLTVCLWAYVLDAAFSYELFSITDNSAGNNDAMRMECNQSLSQTNFSYRHLGAETAVIFSNSTIKPGWNHFLATVDNTNSANAYLNGTLAGGPTGIGVTTPSGLAVTNVGAYVSNSGANIVNPLNGYISDVGVWNIVLSGSQITALASGTRPGNVQGANLKLWWPLNGFTNTTENDLSGGANNGTLSPGSASGPFPILGPPQTWRLG
jgi:hypothetical protein